MKTIVVTRPAGADDPLVVELESRGYRVIAVPTVATRLIDVDWPDLRKFDWVVLTSAAGVAALPVTPPGPRWAAVGAATAKALRARGVDVDVIPAEANGAALASALRHAAGARVLLVRASLADRDLPDALRARGASVEEVTAYETVEGPEESREALRHAMSERVVSAVVFASGSAVRGYVKLGGVRRVPAVTIGPRTTKVARDQGFTVAGESVSPRVAELAEAVGRAISIEVASDA